MHCTDTCDRGQGCSRAGLPCAAHHKTACLCCAAVSEFPPHHGPAQAPSAEMPPNCPFGTPALPLHNLPGSRRPQPARQALAHLARALQADQRGVGGLGGGQVLACSLAQLLSGGSDVQNVIHDLERGGRKQIGSRKNGRTFCGCRPRRTLQLGELTKGRKERAQCGWRNFLRRD